MMIAYIETPYQEATRRGVLKLNQFCWIGHGGIMNRTQTWTSLASFKQRCWRLNQVLNCYLSSSRPLFCSNLPTWSLMYYLHLGHLNNNTRCCTYTHTRYSGCGADQNWMSRYRKKVLHSIPPKMYFSPSHRLEIKSYPFVKIRQGCLVYPLT